MTRSFARPPARARTCARALPALVLLGLMLSAAAGAASAHGYQTSGDPVPYSLLDDAPERVVVHMSEPIEPAFSRVHVYDADGVDHARGDAYVEGGNTSRLAVDVGPLPNGTYTVAWEARWPSDGHDTKGSYGFAVGNVSLSDAFLSGTVRNEFAGPDAAEVALRTLLFIGSFVAVGALLFHLVVDRGVTGPRGAWRAQVAALAGALAVAFATLGLLLRLSASGYDTTLAGAFAYLPQMIGSTQLGGVLAVRILLALALALLLAVTLRQASRRTILAATGAALPLLVTLSLTSHAAAQGLRFSGSLLVDLAHVVGGAAWIGGLPLLVLALRALGGRGGSVDGAGPAEQLAFRFSRYAMATSLLVIVTGGIEGFQRLGGAVELLFGTTYGRVLMAKVALVGVLVLVGAFNHFVVIPRMMRRAGDEWRRLSRTSAAETVLAAFVLLAAGALTGLAPEAPDALPAARASGPATFVADSQELNVSLLVSPYRMGVNEFRADLTILENGTALTYAKKVELFLNYHGERAEGVGTSTVVLEHQGNGTYAGRGSLGLPGEWTATVLVQRPDAYDDAATFTLRV